MRGLSVVCAALASLIVVSIAQAVPAGTGVRGTVSASWANTSGSPITSWAGHVELRFEPGAWARRDTIAAIGAPALGEALHPLVASQVQAARVTGLASDKARTELCAEDDGNGGIVYREATSTSSVAAIADGRVAYEVLPPWVDLFTGRGTIRMGAYQHNHFEGHWTGDRLVLPGRWSQAGTWPCPGDGAPALRLPRILALHGQGAVPRPVSDWLTADDWRLRRTPSGWRVMMDASRRVTFSESPFGPQSTQAMDLRVRSRVYLAGSLRRLGALCRVPVERLERARSVRQALRIARRAGLTRTRYAGRRTLPAGWRSTFTISGRLINSQGHAPCMKGAYRIHHHVPRR